MGFDKYHYSEKRKPGIRKRLGIPGKSRDPPGYPSEAGTFFTVATHHTATAIYNLESFHLADQGTA